MVVLAGESGIGKTRIASELAVRAHELGIRTITGECDAHGSPLHPLRPLLRAIAERCREDGVARRMLGPLGGLLATYEPSLAGLAPPITDRIDPTVARFRVLSVLRDSIKELAIDEPLLLVIDDLQWADELTLALLHSFKTAQRNLVVLATVREEEATPAIAKLLRELPITHVGLARLSEDAVTAIVRDMLAITDDPDALAEQIAARSEGNPLFAAEYVRSAVEDGVLRRDPNGQWKLAELRTPATVRTIIARRLHALSPAAKHVALAASVLGRSCDATVLAATADMSEETARATMPELLSHHVLEEAGGNTLRFTHDALREAAYAELGDAAATMHRAAAVALADRGDLHLEELAHHWERAGDLERAADMLERAANHALANAAFGEAKDLWQHLLAIKIPVGKSRRATWERALGETHYALGDLAQCSHHLTIALELLDEPRIATNTSIAAGLGRQILHRTLGPTSADPALATAALACARMTTYYFFNDDTRGFLGSALRAINLAERVGTNIAVAEIYGQLGYIAGIAKLERVARGYFDRGLAVADASHDPVGEARVLFSEAALHVGRGEWSEASALARRGQVIAIAMRNPQDEEVAHTILGHCEFATGDYRASQRSAKALYDSAHARANTQHEAWGIYTDARASLYLGELDAAIAGFTHAMDILATIRDRASEILCGGMLASALARAGRSHDARVAADRTTALIGKTTPPVFTISEGFIGAADAYLELWQRGDASAAKPAAIAAANVARLAKTFPVASPAAHALAGRAHALLDERRTAKKSFIEALARAERFAMPYDEAVALQGLGSLGDHAAAARASKIFERLGCN
ncbi:MAG: AAA family ATPase [Kofleriaceae bacterium]